MVEFARVWLAAAIAGAVVALLTAGLARWWRRGDAALWHRIYTVAMTATLVTPVAGLVLPGIRLAWHSSSAGGEIRASASLLTALVVVYAAGLLAMLIRLVIGLAAVRRLRHGSVALDDTWRQRVMPVVGAEASRCWWHAQVRAPLTMGWWEPRVVLPAAALRWSEEQLRAVLHHELAHVRRHDYALNLIAALQVAVYWPSPAAWWLAQRARLAAEVACDQRAAAVVGETEYARVLVQCARQFVDDGLGAGLVAPGAGTDVFARVELLIATRKPVAPLGRTARALLLTGITVMLLLAGVVRVAPIAGPRPPVEPGLHAIMHGPGHLARHR